MSDTNSPKRKQKTLSQILAICFVILFILSCQIQFPQPWIGMVIQGVLAGALVLIALNILKELQQETENTQHNILQNLKDKTEDLKEFVSKSDADIIQKMGLYQQFISQQQEETKNFLSNSFAEVKDKLEATDNALTEFISRQHEETINSLRKMNLEINDKFLEFQNMISSLNSLFDKSYVSVSNAINSLINKEDVENAVFNVLSEFDQFEKIRIEISNLSRLFKLLSYSKTDEYTNPNRIETINDEANKLLIRNHYEHNKIKKSEMLKDGKISYLVNYDTFGNISDSISYDNNGLIMMQTTYYSNGQIKQRIEFKNGKKFAVANFNENGEKQK